MTVTARNKLICQIKSAKVEERRSAVWAMWKSGDASFASIILAGLKNERLQDPSVWKSKCMMIAALGDLHYRKALPFLKILASHDFSPSPIIHSELAMAMCQLQKIGSGNMGFVREAMKSKKPLFVCGAYHAIHYMDFDLEEKEIVPLIRFAREYSKRHREDEQLTCMPRDYLAASAYRWKGTAVRKFLNSCRASRYPHLQEIAAASLAGKRSKDSRLGWYR